LSGWKDWQIGEVVEAAEFQTFIQDQVVQVYADSSARGSALGTAVAEGMASYLKDTESFEVYSPSGWVEVAPSYLTAGTAGEILRPNGTADPSYVAAETTLTAGTSGLTALSAGTAGISYQPVSHNYIINGAFDVWQRGTSFATPNNVYTADRWRSSAATAFPTRSVSQQTFTPADLAAIGFGESPFFLRSEITTVGSSTEARITNRIEDVRTLAGQTATLSFWAKSDTTRTHDARLVQNFGSGGSAQVTVFQTNFVATTTWQQFTFTGNVGSLSGKTIGAGNYLEAVMTQALADGSVFDIWGVQLEAGSVATPFKRHAPDVGLEKVACKRYFQVFGGGHRFARVGSAFAFSSTQFRVPLFLPVEMRATPSLNPVPVGSWRIESNGLYAISSFALDSPNAKSIGLNCAVTGATIGFGGQLTASDDLNARIYLDAEI